jgi:hypothetical protein
VEGDSGAGASDWAGDSDAAGDSEGEAEGSVEGDGEGDVEVVGFSVEALDTPTRITWLRTL